MSNLDSATILVVDDHDLSRQVLQAILTSGGYQVVVAHDGAEAWNILDSEEIALMIADLRMPGLNGFELCRRVKSDTRTRLVPVIIVTGADDISSRIAAFEHGADDILPKPVINEELVARVRNLLRFSHLVRGQLEVERAQAALEKELALAQLRKEQEFARNRLYHDVLFAATGGRLQLMSQEEMSPLLEGWSQVCELLITEPSQIAVARRIAEEVAQSANLDAEGASDAALCVSEAVTNALKFGTRVIFRGGAVRRSDALSHRRRRTRPRTSAPSPSDPAKGILHRGFHGHGVFFDAGDDGSGRTGHRPQRNHRLTFEKRGHR